ncbi:hypothetical protein D3C76_1425380 [compost metagenome]
MEGRGLCIGAGPDWLAIDGTCDGSVWRSVQMDGSNCRICGNIVKGPHRVCLFCYSVGGGHYQHVEVLYRSRTDS